MSLSAEESNFLRFYFLNLKIASKAVRTYFDSVHPPSGLASELANCSVTLKRLRFITNSQLKILYPSTARNVRSEDFDTTLMVCLLRNMTPHECAPRTGWDNLPLQGDASTGADLARVKWYRNMLTHHEDGKLSPVDFIQYWTDLESAILRLGGPSLHQESQSAQHIVLDTSLTDMLNTVRNCQKDILNLQMSHEKHTSMITDLQTTLHNQKLVKEKHETEIQLLQDSLQKGETVDQNLATKLSDATVSIAKSKEEIKACHKEIETNEVRFKDLQEQLLNKQIQIDKLVTEVDKFEVKNEQQVIIFKENGEQIRKHDRKLAKQSEQLAEHDEQIALNAKDIDDIKKKQHNTDDSSSESRRKRLEDDTKALIKEDLREGTFVTTEAAEDGLLLLKQNGVLLITGHAGTGKSRISRHILHMFCTEYTSFKCIKLDKLQEWEDMVNRDDNVVILLDDIFGETNCIYNREKDIPILDKVHAYVCKSNIKVLITIRDTVKRQCQVVFDSHRLFKFDFVDLSSDKYKLCEKVKQNILTVYMKTVRQSDYIHSKGFVDQSCNTIMQLREIYKITNINPVKGFPLAVYQFVHSDKYFQLGFTFFDRPTETILDEINEIRRQGEIHKKFMIQYGVMVYTAINEHGIDPDDNSNVTEVVKIIDAIYGETIRIKRCQISDAVMELKGSYLVKIPNQRSYRYHHPTLQESVILSFAQIDNENLNKIIPLLSWTFFMKMVKPYGYNEKEGEVVLKIPTSSYKLLAYRLADIYTEVFRTIPYGIYNFLESLSNTEIFQNVDCVLLTYILDVVEKTDQKNHNIETMIRFNDMNSFLSYLQKKDVFLAVYLVVLATKERQLEIFQFILQRINQIIRTKNCYFTIDYIKAALITSLYQICSKKDVKIVKYVKSLMDIVEINRIPVLLDQNIQLTEMTSPLLDISIFDYYNSETTCVFLTLCIVNAYKQFNIPLLEFLLSEYNETPFHVNLFLKVFYEHDHFEMSPLFNESLKWMIQKFEDQEVIDYDIILRKACTKGMIDTVKYLVKRCKTFDAISYLKIILGFGDLSIYLVELRGIGINPFQNCSKDVFNFIFSRIDCTSTELTSFLFLLLRNQPIVPDYIFDAFLPFFLNNNEVLILACKNAHFYFAKQLIEKSQIVDFQKALSSCLGIREANWCKSSIYSEFRIDMIYENEQLKFVKYIVNKFGYEHFDLKAVCRQANHFKAFKVIEWFVLNVDSTLLKVDSIRNSLLKEGKLEILKYMIDNTKLTSLEKMKVLISTTKNYTTGCSTEILEIVNAVWDSTDNKKELNMEEIVKLANKSNCFNLLMWIYENCNSYVSTDVKKLLLCGCENGSIKVTKWILQAFELKSWDIDEGKLFISACDKMCVWVFGLEEIERINLVFKHFQIKPNDLKSGLIRLLSKYRNEWDLDAPDEFSDLVVSIFEKCFHCLNTKDLEVVMNKSLYQKNHFLVNLLLENDRFCSFDKQYILNKACTEGAFKTIKLVSKHFSSLDMNMAIIYACTSKFGSLEYFDMQKRILACLDLMWNETNHESIDVSRIVSTVCKEDYISDTVMTWILQNFHHNQIPIKDVLIACCKQGKIYHVKYIFHEVDNEQLDIKEAFFQTCQNKSSVNNTKIKSLVYPFMTHKPCMNILFRFKNNNVMLVDFLFQRLHDKNSSLSVLLDELFYKNRFDLILYFLRKGYCMNIDMKSLMNQACRIGHARILQWILANVQHKKLDVKSAFHEACHCEGDKIQLKCVALIWHYIRDINVLDIETVLKSITEAPPKSRYKYERLMNWIRYIQNITLSRTRKSETSV